jgi:hypothetical protein
VYTVNIAFRKVNIKGGYMLEETHSLARRFLHISILAVLPIFLFACGSNANDTSEPNKNPTDTSNEQSLEMQSQMHVLKSNDTQKKEAKQMTLTGKISYQEFEGGFYGFIANNGDKYTPSGLKNEYRKNGLIVEMKCQAMEGMATTKQFGKLVKVLEIKVLDTSKVSVSGQTH